MVPFFDPAFKPQASLWWVSGPATLKGDSPPQKHSQTASKQPLKGLDHVQGAGRGREGGERGREGPGRQNRGGIGGKQKGTERWEEPGRNTPQFALIIALNSHW